MALEQMFWEYSEKDDNTVVSFAAFVINRGASSVLHNWRANYTVGKSTERMSVMYPQGEWVLRLVQEWERAPFAKPALLYQPAVRFLFRRNDHSRGHAVPWLHVEQTDALR